MVILKLQLIVKKYFDGDYPVNAVNAYSDFIILDSENAADTETITIDEFVYTFVTALTEATPGQDPVPYEVKIGAAAADTIQNLVDAINADETAAGSEYATGTPVNPLVTASVDGTVDRKAIITAKYAGEDGDEITLETDVVEGAVGNAELENGQNGTIAPYGGLIFNYPENDFAVMSLDSNTIREKNWRYFKIVDDPNDL